MLPFFDGELKKYKLIRGKSMPLMNRLSQTLPKELILQAAEDLRMLAKDRRTLRFEDEDETAFLMDRAIHDIPFPTYRWIEQALEKPSNIFSRVQEGQHIRRLFLSGVLRVISMTQSGNLI